MNSVILYDQFGKLIKVPTEHHIWCNFSHRPIESCETCVRLWKDYPYDTTEDAQNLMAKHFPQNIRRT